MNLQNSLRNFYAALTQPLTLKITEHWSQPSKYFELKVVTNRCETVDELINKLCS